MQRITQLAAGLLAAAALAPAAAAQADSIAYIKDGNVWLASGDGARLHQVTASGIYSYASQADDGTLIALAADRHLHRIDRASGAVTADFSTPVSDTPPNAAFVFSGPYAPQISPDGTRVAYGYSAQYTRYDPYCGYPGGCREGKRVIGTGYSHADRLTSWDEPGFKMHSGWQHPSWIDNQHVLISQPWELGNLDFWVDTVGDDQYGRQWYGVSGDGDAEVSRANTGVAAIASTGKFIGVDRMTGAWPDATVERCLFLGDREGPTLTSPSWSPDGTRIAYSDGVSVQILANVLSCDEAAVTTTRLDAGGYPDWGPADLPPVRAVTPPPPPPPPPARDPVRGDPPARRAPGKAPVRNALGATGTIAGRSLNVRLTAPGAGRLTAVASVRGRRVASTVKRVRGKGAVTLRLPIRRALRRGGTVKLRLSFKPARGATKTVTLDVKVRR